MYERVNTIKNQKNRVESCQSPGLAQKGKRSKIENKMFL